jgi:hypothetical protein
MPVFDYNVVAAPDPEAERMAARAASYPNTTDEQAEVTRVDSVIFDRARYYEGILVAQGQELLNRSGAATDEAEGLMVSLSDEVTTPLDFPNRYALPDVAGRYKELAGKARAQIEQLERAAREAEWAADRCDDPYGSYRKLISRYPVLAKRA